MNLTRPVFRTIKSSLHCVIIHYFLMDLKEDYFVFLQLNK